MWDRWRGLWCVWLHRLELGLDFKQVSDIQPYRQSIGKSNGQSIGQSIGKSNGRLR
jgi:hypothetical protein